MRESRILSLIDAGYTIFRLDSEINSEQIREVSGWTDHVVCKQVLNDLRNDRFSVNHFEKLSTTCRKRIWKKQMVLNFGLHYLINENIYGKRFILF